jgi:hypothetical protein
VIVVVAVFAALALALAAFALDLGNAWQEKRRLHTATDAGALAAAHEYANGGDGCASFAGTYVTQNEPTATMTSCTSGTGTGGSSGYVTVKAKATVNFAFASTFGVSSQDVHSSTTAVYGSPTGMSGLRPMGLCIDSNPLFTAWLNLPHGPTGPSGTIRMFYTKAQPEACGSTAPGNWGMLNFDGGSNSKAKLRDWETNGYPGFVPLSPPTVPGDPGAFSNGSAGAISTLVNTTFQLPVWDSVSGNGANAQFNIVAFVTVKLIGYQLTGAESSRYMDLQFLNAIVDAPCCGRGPNTGTQVVAICAVNNDPVTGQCGI